MYDDPAAVSAVVLCNLRTSEDVDVDHFERETGKRGVKLVRRTMQGISGPSHLCMPMRSRRSPRVRIISMEGVRRRSQCVDRVYSAGMREGVPVVVERSVQVGYRPVYTVEKK